MLTRSTNHDGGCCEFSTACEGNCQYYNVVECSSFVKTCRVPQDTIQESSDTWFALNFETESSRNDEYYVVYNRFPGHNPVVWACWVFIPMELMVKSISLNPFKRCCQNIFACWNQWLRERGCGNKLLKWHKNAFHSSITQWFTHKYRFGGLF